ncbi:MAG: hypothetical protein M5U14_16125 [Acidimicrobiia bacterium]|nr:hypothetical protein [Acidimicrobiia bacterium]
MSGHRPTRQVLDVGEHDDLPHAPSASPTWRESLYFEVCDQALDLWCYQYVGERLNKDHAGLALAVRTGDGRQYGRLDHGPVDRDERAHRCAGLEIATVDPMRRHRVTFDGPVVGPHAASPGALRMPPSWMRPDGPGRGPVEPARLELAFEATTPFYTFPTNLLLPFFAGHIQQMGVMRGTLRLGDEELAVEGPTFRDRSWGDRDWFGIDQYLWIYAPFPDLALATTRIVAGDVREVVGWTWDGHRPADVVAWPDEQVTWDATGGKPLPVDLAVEVRDDRSRRQELEITLLGAAPSVFEGRGPLAGKLAWIDRCPARIRRGDQEVLGVVESQQVVDRPEGWS